MNAMVQLMPRVFTDITWCQRFLGCFQPNVKKLGVGSEVVGDSVNLENLFPSPSMLQSEVHAMFWNPNRESLVPRTI